MQISLKTNKTLISSWLLGGFLFTLLIASAISFLFQDNMDQDESFNQRVLFKKNEFSRLTKIIIKNQIGTFVLKKTPENFEEWYLTDPRTFPANLTTLESIQEALEKISILKSFKNDAINISHYSLSNPFIEIDFWGPGNENYQLRFGIINPIDNSTYISHSKFNEIFQIKTLIFNLEGLILSDFIDARIFPSNKESIKSLTVFKGDKKFNNSLISIEKKDANNWLFKNRQDIGQERIHNFINKLLELKGQMILDKITDEAQKSVDQYLNYPLYSVEAEQINGKKITYTISNVIESLPNVKAEKRSCFLVKASNRKHSYLVSKEHLEAFSF